MSRGGRKKKRMMRRMERWVEDLMLQPGGPKEYYFLGFGPAKQKPIYAAIADYPDFHQIEQSILAEQVVKSQVVIASINSSLMKMMYGDAPNLKQVGNVLGIPTYVVGKAPVD